MNIIEILGTEKINLRSRSLISHSLFPERIEIVENFEYKLYVHSSSWGTPQSNCITIILTAHGNNVEYFKESVESVLNQSSRQFELILIDHGCAFELRNSIHDYFLKDEKIKLIVFKENLYDPKINSIVNERFTNVLNTALFCSEGDYVYFLSYDDFLSSNYVACLLPLFMENLNCVAATPRVVSVNEYSEINVTFTNLLYKGNLRSKYMSGIALATSVIHGENLFSAPGGLCCFKTEVVLAGGGFDNMSDHSQIFKFSILGDVGTSQDAVLYWRHHDNQTNKLNKRLGSLYYTIQIEWLHHIKSFYAVMNIPKIYQKMYFKYMENYIYEHCIICICDSIKSGLKGAAGVFVEIIKTAPKIYILIYIKYFLRNIPYLIYRSMPERVKVLFRNIKKKLLRSFANP